MNNNNNNDMILIDDNKQFLSAMKDTVDKVICTYNKSYQDIINKIKGFNIEKPTIVINVNLKFNSADKRVDRLGFRLQSEGLSFPLEDCCPEYIFISFEDISNFTDKEKELIGCRDVEFLDILKLLKTTTE